MLSLYKEAKIGFIYKYNKKESANAASLSFFSINDNPNNNYND